MASVGQLRMGDGGPAKREFVTSREGGLKINQKQCDQLLNGHLQLLYCWEIQPINYQKP